MLTNHREFCWRSGGSFWTIFVPRFVLFCFESLTDPTNKSTIGFINTAQSARLTGGWLNDWVAPCFRLFLSVMRPGTHRAGSPLRVRWWAGTLWWLLMSGERTEPLGVRVGRMWGSVQMGSHLALTVNRSSHPHLPLSPSLALAQPLSLCLLSDPKGEERGLRHQKVSLIVGATHKEIRQWHLGIVWWPEMERLDFRYLKLNSTAGVGGRRRK